MNEDLVKRLVGENVRVWDGQHSTVRAEGKVIAVILCPTLVIVDEEGARHHEPSSLPVEVMTWQEAHQWDLPEKTDANRDAISEVITRLGDTMLSRIRGDGAS